MDIQCFFDIYFLAIMNNIAINTHEQVFQWTCFQLSHILRSRTAWSYSNSMANLLRNSQLFAKLACTVLHSRQQDNSFSNLTYVIKSPSIPVLLTSTNKSKRNDM